MALELSDENSLTRFNSLAEQGIIHYRPSTVISLVDNNFPFEFRICQTLSRKPMTLDSTVPSLSSTSKFGPGSDINVSHPSKVLCPINSTHIIALNIYPIFRPQFLLLTLDSYRLQSEALDLEDSEALLKFLGESGAERYDVMYNFAEESGCIRKHKHVQIVPKPNFSEQGGGFRFFPDIKGWEDTVEVPYMYF